jgi:hypothetical protein
MKWIKSIGLIIVLILRNYQGGDGSSGMAKENYYRGQMKFIVLIGVNRVFKRT